MPLLTLKIRCCALLGALLLTLAGPTVKAQDAFNWEQSSYAVPSNVWGGVEALAWWRTGRNLPPLVTTGDPANPEAGILDQPDTVVLFGQDRIGGELRVGGRGWVGMWIAPEEAFGVGLSFFALGEQTTRFQLASGGVPVIAIPFFDVAAQGEDALPVASPVGGPGSVDFRTSSDVLGGDAFFRGALIRDRTVRLDWLVGYQMARIDEDLVMISAGAIGGPVERDVVDVFIAQNEFHAATFGFLNEYRLAGWSCELLAKVGLGSMQQTVNINGQTTLTDVGGSVTTAGGHFAQATNSGRFVRNHFAVSPEVGLKLAYEWDRNTRLSLGYSFLYFTHVVQPGDQIDRGLNDAGRPNFSFNDDGYWAQGLNCGIDWRF